MEDQAVEVVGDDGEREFGIGAGQTDGADEEARADVFDYIERLYNAVRRHSTIGYVSPVGFERQVGLA